MKQKARCIAQSIVGHFYEDDCIGWDPDEWEGAVYEFVRGSEERFSGLRFTAPVGQYVVGREYMIEWHTEPKHVVVREREVLDRVEEIDAGEKP